MSASPSRGAAVADATAQEPCVCRRFASDIFVRSSVLSFFRSSFLSSLPGEDPAIHAEVLLARRSHRRFACWPSTWTTGIGVQRTPFCERLCPVVDKSETVASHSSDAEKRIARTMVVAVYGKGRVLRAIVLQTCRCGAVSIRG